ncbi:MAG: cupin domain-containing protein [Bacteroidota bacterium]|nr:cupin domain-containing protein [Bacteroidota bacterium]
MKQSHKFLYSAFLPWTDLGNGVRRQIMGYNDDIMLVKVEFKEGGTGALHQHPHTQSTFVASGIFELTIGKETRIIKPGDGFLAPPNVAHGVVCIEKGTLIDTFSPIREDFLT